MKKFLIWAIIIIAIVASIDILFNILSKRYVKSHHLPGDYTSTEYLIKESTDSILVMGSSVALNSFDTRSIQDSIGTSAYNAGANGQTFPFYLTMLECLLQRHTPRVIILAMADNNLQDTGLGTRFSFLAPYYKIGYDNLDRRMESRDKMEKYFLTSSLYRYNTAWFRILLYHFMHNTPSTRNGFEEHEIPAYFPRKNQAESKEASDERKEQFRQFVDLCQQKGVELIVCLTPQFSSAPASHKVADFISKEAAQRGFIFWNDEYGTELSSDSTLFFDNVHFNKVGSKIYTDTIINRLKSMKI